MPDLCLSLTNLIPAYRLAGFVRLGLVWSGLLYAGLAAAVTEVSVADVEVVASEQVTPLAPIPVRYKGDGVTVGYQCEISYPTDQLDVVVSGQGTGLCVADDSLGVVRILDVTDDLSPLGDTVSCQLNFVVSPDIPVGTLLPLDIRGCLYSDTRGWPSPGPHREFDGSIVITEGDGHLRLAYSPAPATSINATNGADIRVVATGNQGSASLSNCGFVGGEAQAFSVSPGAVSFTEAGSATLRLGCQRATFDQTSLLRCRATNSDGGDVALEYPVSCDLGAVIPPPPPPPPPTPPPPSTPPIAGGPGIGPVYDFSPGSLPADLACVDDPGGPDFVLTPAAAGGFLVSCATGLSGATGSVSCTYSASGVLTAFQTQVVCPQGSVRPIAVPASGRGALALIAGLLAISVVLLGARSQR